MHTKRLAALAFIAVAGAVSAQTGPGFSMTMNPSVLLPLPGSSSEDRYALGAMGSVGADWAPAGAPFLSVLGSIDYSIVPYGSDLSLQAVGGAAGLGLRLGLSRSLSLGLSGRGGVAYGMLGEAGAVTPYAVAGLEASLALSPSFSLRLGGGYLHQFAASGPLYQGLGASLTAGFNFSRMDARPRLRVREVELSPVFPVFYKHYDSNPLGRAVVVNEEGGAVRDVRVSVFSPQYMDAPKLCASIPAMARGERAEVLLYALFDRRILAELEATKAQLQVIVEYEYAGVDKRAEAAETVTVNHRNASSWDDDRKAAAFVTLNDPAVMRLAKAAAGVARGAGYVTIDTNLRQAVGVFEGLRLHGVDYVPDAAVPYSRSSADETAVDYLQFPAQTLEFHAGDCDDLSILYAALLEASGVESALVTVPGHIYTAFALGMGPGQGRAFFPDYGDVIELDGKLWLPVEVTVLGEGFMRAWQLGARQWRDASAKGQAALYPVRDAWKLYEPVAMIGAESSVTPPSADRLRERYAASMDALVAREMAPLAEKAKAAAAKAQADPGPLNALGIVYARFSRFDDAEKAFAASARLKPNAPAAVNLGNVYLIRGEYRKALDAFVRALSLEPKNPGALAGAAQAAYELDDRAGAARYLDELAAVSERAAARYAYIKYDTGARAASAADAPSFEWEE